MPGKMSNKQRGEYTDEYSRKQKHIRKFVIIIKVEKQVNNNIGKEVIEKVNIQVSNSAESKVGEKMSNKGSQYE